MPKTSLTEIIAVLDRSGSMASVAKDTKGGFDTFIEEQKKLPGECRLTLVQFDSGGIDTVHENKPVAQVPPLEFVPRGMTPLLDAIGSTIDQVGTRLAATSETERPEKVVFIIMTDGQENCSHKFSREEIQKKIAEQTNVWKWQFTYLGANVDAFGEAQRLGISLESAASYDANSAGVQNAYRSLSKSTGSLRSGASVSMSYDGLQRAAMGGQNAHQVPLDANGNPLIAPLPVIPPMDPQDPQSK